MKVVVTAGPTRENIDAVRFITNASSGRMGHAVASAASRRGHDVQLVTGPCIIQEPEDVEVTHVTTALEMEKRVLECCSDADALVMTAAVSDWRVKSPSGKKIDKGSDSFTLELVPNPDILLSVTRANPDLFAVAFALETDMNKDSALDKMSRKGARMVVLDTVSAMGAETAEFEIYDGKGSELLSGCFAKSDLAEKLVELLEKEMAS